MPGEDDPHEICRRCGWRRDQHKRATMQCPDRAGSWSKTKTFTPKLQKGQRWQKKPDKTDA